MQQQNTRIIIFTYLKNHKNTIFKNLISLQDNDWLLLDIILDISANVKSSDKIEKESKEEKVKSAKSTHKWNYGNSQPSIQLMHFVIINVLINK